MKFKGRKNGEKREDKCQEERRKEAVVRRGEGERKGKMRVRKYGGEVRRAGGGG